MPSKVDPSEATDAYESAPDRPASAGESTGARIGPYTLAEKLGEGGMGAVWVAVQSEPIKRRVALKVIKPGMDSAQVLHRFEAERQALALMDHTNIAKVLDAGATTAGRPYFVMELIKGVPITRYCDELNLPIRERLELFAPVCQAIQHAHQKGIIHRDVKPSNVLVCMQDGRPVPKVIDFGVAKATSQQLTNESMYTGIGQIVGTLHYMAPEQAELSALDIDTRADVYALGVLLYELVTGTTPLDPKRLKQEAYSEVVRLIREAEPPRPSTRLTESKESLAALAAKRRTRPELLTKQVRGELDWIVMKCLEKDRTRRYGTASSLADDLGRYLSDRPVEACPPAAGYRLRKFARRYRAALLTVAAFASLLVIAVILSTWQAIRATRAEDQALHEARRALAAEATAQGERDKAVTAGEQARQSAAETRAVLSFLLDHVLAAARPLGQGGGLGKDVTVRQALDAAEPKIAESFQEQAVVEASIRLVLGTTYTYLGELATAIRELECALELRSAKLGMDHVDTARAQFQLAIAYRAAGQWKQAIPLYEQALTIERGKLGPDHPEVLLIQNMLGMACRTAGQTDRAMRLFEQTLAARRDKLGAEHADTLFTQNSLAQMCKDVGQLDRAIDLHKQTLAAQAKTLGPEHADTLVTQNSLGMDYREAGQLEQAIELHKRTLAPMEARLGRDHPFTLYTLSTLALAYKDAGRLKEAIPLFEATLTGRKVKIGPDHPDTLITQSGLAAAYQDSGQLQRAIALHNQTLEQQQAKLTPDHPNILLTQNHLARAVEQAGDGY